MSGEGKLATRVHEVTIDRLTKENANLKRTVAELTGINSTMQSRLRMFEVILRKAEEVLTFMLSHPGLPQRVIHEAVDRYLAERLGPKEEE